MTLSYNYIALSTEWGIDTAKGMAARAPHPHAVYNLAVATAVYNLVVAAGGCAHGEGDELHKEAGSGNARETSGGLHDRCGRKSPNVHEDGHESY